MIRRLTAFTASLLIAGACVATVATGTADSGRHSWHLDTDLERAFAAPVLLQGHHAPRRPRPRGGRVRTRQLYDRGGDIRPGDERVERYQPDESRARRAKRDAASDGRVLVAGGDAGPVLSSAEIFDPSTGQWQVTGSMNVNRTRQAAVRLCDGRVLVVGGWNGQGMSAAETYDPSTGVWTLTAGSLPDPAAESRTHSFFPTAPCSSRAVRRALPARQLPPRTSSTRIRAHSLPPPACTTPEPGSAVSSCKTAGCWSWAGTPQTVPPRRRCSIPPRSNGRTWRR